MRDGVDFFISYNSADVEWAEWIAWILEKDGGYAVCYQLRDFPPGTNFVSKMHEAAALARHTIAVLSPAYLNATFTGSEWWAAFAQDPLGTDRRLIPVMVSECEPGGLLRSIVSIRLMGLGEADARDALLRGVAKDPVTGPTGTRRSQPKEFPGVVRPESAPARPTAPRIPERRRVPEDTGYAEPAAEQVPWTSLSDRIPVRWEGQPAPTANDGGTVRLELHLIPLSTRPDSTTPSFHAQGALVSAGRHCGVFPSAATVSIQATKDYLAAVLTDTTASVTSGVRIDSGGERSAWLTLPRPPQGDLLSAITSQLAKLLQALASLPPALPERVTLAAAMSTPRGQARLDPRESLPSSYLTSHTRQVAAELARQLN